MYLQDYGVLWVLMMYWGGVLFCGWFCLVRGHLTACGG